MKELFLDANAHLPLNPKALKAYTDFHHSPAGHGHPSSPNVPGRLAAQALEFARAKIATLIGAKKSSNIIFTSNCTQACEWATEIALKNYKQYSQIYRSSAEHTAISDALDTYAEKYKLKINKIPLKNTGEINTENVNGLICCIYVQNEIGVIQPINELKNSYIFSDMSQALGKIPVNVSDLNVDLAVFGAHKFGGPGGLGFIYIKDPSDYLPFGTGSRYFLDRTGTPDVAAAVAAAAALEDAVLSLSTRISRMTKFRDTLEEGLESLGLEIIGKNANRAPGTTFVRIPNKGLHSVIKLGEQGIYVGLGSACGSVHTGESPLMREMGCPGTIHDFMRISQFGEYGAPEAKHFLNILRKVL